MLGSQRVTMTESWVERVGDLIGCVDWMLLVETMGLETVDVGCWWLMDRCVGESGYRSKRMGYSGGYRLFSLAKVSRPK